MMTEEAIAKAKRVLRDPKEGEVLYMPIEHPAFANWRVKQPCIERAGMIDLHLRHAELRPESVRDVGCHTGWFCRSFAIKYGAVVYGMEKSTPWHDVAASLNDLLIPDAVPPHYRNVSVGADTRLPTADVTLCLSVLMYLFDDKEQGWDTLRNIADSTKVMFADYGGKYADRLPFIQEEMADEIVDRTSFTRAEHLGFTDFERRPLYAFWR